MRGRRSPTTGVPYNGNSAGGTAASFAYGFACGEVFCSESYREQTVKLSK